MLFTNKTTCAALIGLALVSHSASGMYLMYKPRPKSTNATTIYQPALNLKISITPEQLNKFTRITIPTGLSLGSHPSFLDYSENDALLQEQINTIIANSNLACVAPITDCPGNTAPKRSTDITQILESPVNEAAHTLLISQLFPLLVIASNNNQRREIPVMLQYNAFPAIRLDRSLTYDAALSDLRSLANDVFWVYGPTIFQWRKTSLIKECPALFTQPIDSTTCDEFYLLASHLVSALLNVKRLETLSRILSQYQYELKKLASYSTSDLAKRDITAHITTVTALQKVVTPCLINQKTTISWAKNKLSTMTHDSRTSILRQLTSKIERQLSNYKDSISTQLMAARPHLNKNRVYFTIPGTLPELITEEAVQGKINKYIHTVRRFTASLKTYPTHKQAKIEIVKKKE